MRGGGKGFALLWVLVAFPTLAAGVAVVQTLQKSIIVPSCQAMLEVGGRLAAAFVGGGAVWLLGPPGAGKTVCCRGMIQALLSADTNISSPTYTLVESYQAPTLLIHHFDFFRLHSAQEVEYIGVRDYFGDNQLCLIEWPQAAVSILPPPDLTATIDFAPQGRRIELCGLATSRLAAVTAAFADLLD